MKRIYMVYQRHSDGGSAIYPAGFFETRLDAERFAATRDAMPKSFSLFGNRPHFITDQCVTPDQSYDAGHEEDMRILRKEQLEADCGGDMADEPFLDDDRDYIND